MTRNPDDDIGVIGNDIKNVKMIKIMFIAEYVINIYVFIAQKNVQYVILITVMNLINVFYVME